MFSSNFLKLSGTRRVFYLRSMPRGDRSDVPIVALHGLGGTSTFWLAALTVSGLCVRRDIYAYDLDGHGLSDVSGRDDLTIDDLVEDLRGVLQSLQLTRVVLLAHSMSGIVVSVFAKRFPDMVERMVLVNPISELPPAIRDGILRRAEAAISVEAMGEIANTISSSAVSKACAAEEPVAMALIRHMVASTKPVAYAAACRAIASAPAIAGRIERIPVHLIGGAEDYLAPPQAVRAWAEKAGGTHAILVDVGHWGAIESPRAVAQELSQALAPSFHHLLLAEFRSPNIYTLRFDVGAQRLSLLHTEQTADGGHSWLDVSPSNRMLYSTVWSDPPTVSCYSISRSTPYPAVTLQRTVPSEFLSGYVCSAPKVLYSACGPQVDVFELDDKGVLRGHEAIQTFALREAGSEHGGGSQMDFGGLRHGGHSCDLSPDGTKLYVADIGHNCVWMFRVDQQTGLLELTSKNIAQRPNDGPRHTWPHPNGKLLYSLQEHSSYVDILEVSSDDTLIWVEGVNILPEGAKCSMYWADEVRLSPSGDLLFGSTRGLSPATKGYVTAWGLNVDGRLSTTQTIGTDTSLHRLETHTSGGWANAIAVCPDLGPHGEVYMTLTDSEEGSVQMLAYKRDTGFIVVDELRLESPPSRGASVAVWL